MKIEDIHAIFNKKTIDDIKKVLDVFMKNLLKGGFNYEEIIIIHDSIIENTVLKDFENRDIYINLSKYWIRQIIEEMRKVPENLEHQQDYLIYCKNLKEIPSDEGYKKYIDMYFEDE